MFTEGWEGSELGRNGVWVSLVCCLEKSLCFELVLVCSNALFWKRHGVSKESFYFVGFCFHHKPLCSLGKFQVEGLREIGIGFLRKIGLVFVGEIGVALLRGLLIPHLSTPLKPYVVLPD